MDLFLYIVGCIVITGIFSALILFVVFVFWIYLSTGLFYVYMIIKAQKKYPNDVIVKSIYKDRKFWKTRLYIEAVFNWKIANRLLAVTITHPLYSIDFCGWYPKGKVK